MRALVYHGPGQKAWEGVPDPEITDDGDAIVRSTRPPSAGPTCTSSRATCSTPTLMRLVTTGQIDAKRFITHHFALEEFEETYDVFARAADTKALKVVLTRGSEQQ